MKNERNYINFFRKLTQKQEPLEEEESIKFVLGSKKIKKRNKRGITISQKRLCGGFVRDIKIIIKPFFLKGIKD